MKPKKPPQQDRQSNLFRPELASMINSSHPLVKHSKIVDWIKLDETFGETYCPDAGRPAISARVVVALHYFKYTYDLSDEDVLSGWIENPYWQYFSGMKHFEHKFPIPQSSMTRWRKRIGEAGTEELLKQIIEAGLQLKAVKPTQVNGRNVGFFPFVDIDESVDLRGFSFEIEAYEKFYHRHIADIPRIKFSA